MYVQILVQMDIEEILLIQENVHNYFLFFNFLFNEF